MTRSPEITAVVIFAACIAFNSWLISDQVGHVLVELPALALCGWLASGRFADREPTWALGGYAPLLVAAFGIAFWMLPRSIDAAVATPPFILAKFTILPLIGSMIRVGWRQAHPLLRGFVKAQTISMCGFMAFLFTHAPVRLCNSYPIDSQWRLGMGFLWLALALAVVWSLPLFVSPDTPRLGPHGLSKT